MSSMTSNYLSLILWVFPSTFAVRRKPLHMLRPLFPLLRTHVRYPCYKTQQIYWPFSLFSTIFVHRFHVRDDVKLLLLILSSRFFLSHARRLIRHLQRFSSQSSAILTILVKLCNSPRYPSVTIRLISAHRLLGAGYFIMTHAHNFPALTLFFSLHLH